MDYFVNLLSQVCIYVIQVATLDLLVGYTGIFSFGHAAFIGIGAYTTALLLTKLHLGFGAVLLGSMLAPMALAFAVGLPTLRLSGDYFVLGTIGLTNVTASILTNWVAVTNGPFGIYGIPDISLFGWKVVTPGQFLAVTIVVTAVVLLVKHLLISAPFGLTLQAIREDETVTVMMGKNVARMRAIAFAIAGAGAGLSGLLTAYNLRFIDPTLFDLQLVIFAWAALFVGGCASIVGNILGPLILVGFPEALRFIGLQGGAVAHVREILYGGLLIVMTIFRPQGIAGNYRIR
ncbi:MAG TPA: branched-chain amino acid ABC transporter permease [Stellaceae bacterium]|nr:branched-chain amino acid ABC transporter permease [Stellaceae bacterium]